MKLPILWGYVKYDCKMCYKIGSGIYFFQTSFTVEKCCHRNSKNIQIQTFKRFASAQFEKCNFFSFKKDFYSSVICARPSFTLRNSTVKMQKVTFSIPAIQHCLKIWTIPGLFSVYFCLFKQTIQFLQQVNVKNFHLV